jgi:hypothetical protein
MTAENKRRLSIVISLLVLNLRWMLCCVSVVVMAMSCAPVIKQFYTDHYYEEDSIYENSVLHFTLIYKGNWHIYTDPSDMDVSSKDFALTLNKRGAELLYIGTTVEGSIGTRGIAINLNEPARDYADQVRFLNKNEIEEDSGLVDFYANTIPMVKWMYSKAHFRFVEFFFNAGTYDIRIAFWCRKESFDNFLPVFENIVSTISFTHGL